MKQQMNETWDNVADVIKVVAVNGLAVITPFMLDIEFWLRMSGMSAALIYTLVKLAAHFRGRKTDGE